MKAQNHLLTRLQAVVYLLEVAVLSGMLTLAAGSSPEFVFGPIARIFVAAAFPLPCHLILAAHVVWAGCSYRQRSVRPVPELQPRPLPA